VQSASKSAIGKICHVFLNLENDGSIPLLRSRFVQRFTQDSNGEILERRCANYVPAEEAAEPLELDPRR